jgi:hypothetical protein
MVSRWNRTLFIKEYVFAVIVSQTRTVSRLCKDRTYVSKVQQISAKKPVNFIISTILQLLFDMNSEENYRLSRINVIQNYSQIIVVFSCGSSE